MENNVRMLIEAFTSSPLFSLSRSTYLCLSQRVNLDEREAVVTLATLADLYVILLQNHFHDIFVQAAWNFFFNESSIPNGNFVET